MAAGGWFDWSTGDLVTESRFQDIQDSIVFIFASESAANSALTNKVEGTIFYDTTANLIKAWSGSAWISAETGDIEVAADVEAAPAPATAEPEAEETAAAADVNEDAKAE